MNAEKLLVKEAKARWMAEIEKAIDKVKLGMIPRKPRTELDEWYRRRFYIETARLAKIAARTGRGSHRTGRPVKRRPKQRRQGRFARLESGTRRLSE